MAQVVGLLTCVWIELSLLMPVEMKDQIDHDRLHNTGEEVEHHSRDNRLQLLRLILRLVVGPYREENCDGVAHDVHQAHGDVEAHRAAIRLQEGVLLD